MTEVRFTDPKTGGQKGQKLERYESIPVWPLSEVARVYGYGSDKYERGNFLKGYPWSLTIDALFRHLFAWLAGESWDKESKRHHLACVVFHAFALMQFERSGTGTDDRMYKESA